MSAAALRLALLILPALTVACAQAPGTARPGPDPHSFAQAHEALMTHLALDFTVDFSARQVHGRADLTLKSSEDARHLWLDTSELTIEGVTDQDGRELGFALGDPVEFLGQPLRVDLIGGTRQVRIQYRSSPGADALLWLDREQTHGKTAPFLFSQSQSVFARSWIPCQDSPGIRFTYEAVVRVPPGLLALMSAENPVTTAADGVYRFRMDQPVPAYLLALAVGDLRFRSLGERTGVYAEPGLLDAAAWEFAQTEDMMSAVEALYGAYRWERFDILVLPPYFPFGGMENPRLTFATPTILAGDRSLVSLIAHELAHSWSGNLVTNRTWNDFWLNEGFTVYLERRIMEQLEGAPYADMLAVLGYQDLLAAQQEFGADSEAMHLVVDLAGRDPEETFSDVPYEKGYFFLRAIEEQVGRTLFDAFLNTYFERYAFRAVDTDLFLRELRAELFSDDVSGWERLDPPRWVASAAIPAASPVQTPAFNAVDAQRDAWLADSSRRPPTEEWTTHHWLHFLRGLPQDIGVDRLAELDQHFKLSQSSNSEILHIWLMTSVRVWYPPAFDALGEFLRGMGRRKFLNPLYRSLAATERGKELALEIYRDARASYHPLATRDLDALLEFSGSTP